MPARAPRSTISDRSCKRGIPAQTDYIDRSLIHGVRSGNAASRRVSANVAIIAAVIAPRHIRGSRVTFPRCNSCNTALGFPASRLAWIMYNNGSDTSRRIVDFTFRRTCGEKSPLHLLLSMSLLSPTVPWASLSLSLSLERSIERSSEHS